MLRFLLQKLLKNIMILLGATLLAFLLMHAIPGSPWSNYSTAPRALTNRDIDAPLQRELNRRFGLNLPLWHQFTRYVVGDFMDDGSFSCGLICGNLGPSIQQSGRSVQDVLFGSPPGGSFWQSRFGYSIRLVLLGALIAIGLGIPLGIVSALKPKSKLSRVISVGLAALISIPNFVLGLLAMVILASWLNVIKVLPDWNIFSSWVVPAVILAVMPMASIARVTRTVLLNTLNEDYVRTAHAKGLTKTRVMLVHIMRNAIVPIITFLGPSLMEMFTSLFIVESLYSFPGIGREYWDAILELDYPMIMGLTLVYATGTLLVNFLVEVLSESLDPRLRSIQQGDAP